ncbi:MAG: pantoate--beta-alanine ligase [Weeksellaceae bacterium]
MEIFHSISALKSWLQDQRLHNKSIGFVPTMGALHEGHMSLIHQSNQENDITICSVFVNPTQFDNADDLQKYPRNTDRDSQLLEDANCDAVFFPTVQDMYPNGTKAGSFTFNGIENQMEGKFRPGHFDGVATIVSRFFDIIQPDKAYFGEKDFQQLRIIQELVKQSYKNLEIVPMPIARAKSGLALSSRNERLSSELAMEAPQIFRILNKIKDWKVEYSVTETIKKVEEAFLATSLKLEYIIICDEESLEPISSWDEAKYIRAFVAAYANDVRLIDNLRIE